jgi:hypothetical protein
MDSAKYLEFEKINVQKKSVFSFIIYMGICNLLATIYTGKKDNDFFQKYVHDV